MSIISKLFGKSPFEALYHHMLKVKFCVDLINPLVEALFEGNYEKVDDYAKKIARAEHEADLVKKEIRTSLPKNILLPVARGDILRFLNEQDHIADAAEDFVVLLTMRKMVVPEEVKEEFKVFVDTVLETCEIAMETSSEIKALAETSFGGTEAHKVMELIEHIKVKEYEADNAQMKTVQKMFSIEKKLDPVSVVMWMHIFGKLGQIANHAENSGDLMGIMLHNTRGK